ncbi:hypothetical protein PC9H_009476 [Pleurotus ostreatus]|uniref:Uncharacterized protein n=2 Tax=Pleurotus ostreatus TaxID=5322 RepID=A0A8H6ZLW9_PLEOS|nr:uncharacterized protein PC9H_009476 [Pleurotus ostreatus]KAF7424173.1 hypothetical protein PC9H_009476 [Pleurotus ostreatus]
MQADDQEEVIADSEEEDIYAPLDTTHETIDHYESTRVTRPSSVDTYGIPTTEPSNISNFTDLPSTLLARSDISSVAIFSTVGDLATTTGSTSRPKPRPIKRKNDLDISNSASSSSALPLVVDDDVKKKDRPRPRPIKRKQSTVDSDPHLEAGGIEGAIVQQTKDNSGPYGMDIAERAKVRRRTAKEKALSVTEPSLAIVLPPQKHKTGNTHPEPLEVIELSSEDELSMAAPARPRKGPKAKGTPRGRAISDTVIMANHTAPVTSSQPTIPVPSSSLSGYHHAPLHLPPSDIPESPLTEPEHPPIAALYEPDSLDIGPQLDQGHEPSLFTPEPAARKRKRGVIYDDDEEDELATIKPPIPTFFASSSPPLNPVKQSKTPSKKQKSYIPLEPLPEATKKKAKPRSKKESTAVSATGDGGSTAPKRKGKGKKKSDEVANVPDEEVEGSHLNMAPPSRLIATPDPDDDSTGRAREEAALVNGPPNPESKRKGNRSRKAETIAPEMALPRVEPFEENPPAKENHPPVTPAKPPGNTSSSASKSSGSSLTSRYSIAPRTKSTPMSELIRRVNSMPGSPFATSPAARTGSAYSPYLKTSKSTLSRIAPLHPNRRAPPPPPPPPPPKKKTKKEIEREEKWEEELIESLGGLDAWVALSDADRKDLRRGKFEMEMNGWD